jgi:hypothetical protein
MAELRVKGTGTLKLFENDNTSSVTIASPASLGGDRTITLPDASVTLASGTMLATDGDGSSLSGVGKIGQVVTSNIDGSGLNTASTSYVTTGSSLAITPTATSSKVLILFTGLEMDNKVAGTVVYATIYNGVTNLASSDNFLYQYDTGRLAYSGVIHHIHSPSSTSAQTYTLYVKCNSNTVSFLEDSADATFTLMEILA